MTELTFVILKFVFILAIWIFAWLAVRSLHRDIAAFLPSRDRRKRKKKGADRAPAKEQVLVGGSNAQPIITGSAAPVIVTNSRSAHAASNRAGAPKGSQSARTSAAPAPAASARPSTQTTQMRATTPAANQTIADQSAEESDLAQLVSATERREASGMPSASTPTLLVIIDGPSAGATLPLGTQPITLGRAPTNTLVLNDEYVSSRHARLFPDPQSEQWKLEDLDSTNGTYVGNSRIVGTIGLPARVPVRIGATTFELR